MIKSVIVGSGMMGVVHSEALHRIPGVEVATFATGWYVLKLVDACLESSASDRWVEVK